MFLPSFFLAFAFYAGKPFWAAAQRYKFISLWAAVVTYSFGGPDVFQWNAESLQQGS